MCADDVVCTGAEPLAFLDYVAVGQLDPVAVAELVGGVAAGCRDAGCALVGGETAEHPGLMEADSFDLAATCIGVVERSRAIDGTAARAGDVILGLAVLRAAFERLLAGAGAARPVGPRPRGARTRSGSAGRSATPRPTRSWLAPRTSRWRPSARSC